MKSKLLSECFKEGGMQLSGLSSDCSMAEGSGTIWRDPLEMVQRESAPRKSISCVQMLFFWGESKLVSFSSRGRCSNSSRVPELIEKGWSQWGEESAEVGDLCSSAILAKFQVVTDCYKYTAGNKQYDNAQDKPHQLRVTQRKQAI